MRVRDVVRKAEERRCENCTRNAGMRVRDVMRKAEERRCENYARKLVLIFKC